jgi:hypothetical protein
MNTPNNKLQLETYLHDLGKMLKDEARSITKEYRAESRPDDRHFLSGKQFAYYEVISTMQQQAIAFGLSLETINLDDVDPDNELEGYHSGPIANP